MNAQNQEPRWWETALAFAWFFLFAISAGLLCRTVRAQDRLQIVKSDGAKFVRLTWHESNVTGVVVTTNLNVKPKLFLHREDTNPTTYVVTILVPVEKKTELFSTAPKFIGAIPEARK